MASRMELHREGGAEARDAGSESIESFALCVGAAIAFGADAAEQNNREGRESEKNPQAADYEMGTALGTFIDLFLGAALAQDATRVRVIPGHNSIRRLYTGATVSSSKKRASSWSSGLSAGSRQIPASSNDLPWQEFRLGTFNPQGLDGGFEQANLAVRTLFEKVVHGEGFFGGFSLLP